MKSRIITIAGSLGSGKSSTGKRLAAELGYEHKSSGDFFRQMAKDRGISIEEINKVAEGDDSIDHATDAWLKELANGQDLVIDSRLAYHWMPNSYKVFLELAPEIAAERIYAHISKEGRESQSADSVAHVLAATKERRQDELRRWKNMYGVDLEDKSRYDLVVDTSKHDLEGVVRIVLEQYREWLKT